VLPQILRATQLPINDAQNIAHGRAQIPQFNRRMDHLPACRNDILDDHERLAADFAALGELTGSVILSGFSDEERGNAAELRQHRSDRYAAQLEPSQRVCIIGNQ
jgi:hypothetical protein